MKVFLLLILLITTSCQPSLLISKEERIQRQKEMKEKLIKCIKENASNEFIEFVNENEANFRYALAKHKKEISKSDLLVVRHCRENLS